MKTFFSISLSLVAAAAVALFFFVAPLERTAFALEQQQSTISPVTLSQADTDAVIRAMAAKETEFRRVLNGYTYKREAIMQGIAQGGQVAGEYRRQSLISFDAAGVRKEQVVKMPISTLPIEPEDLIDIDTIQTFAIDPAKIDQYNFTLVGKERIDDLNTYVFDVAPKVMPKPKRFQEHFFQGRIWVDDRDMQIVKARGKGVPEGKQRFPIFETYREQVDGRYWFPSLTFADDELVFSNGHVARVKLRIRFTDYERGQQNRTSMEQTTISTDTTLKPKAPIMGGVLNGKATALPRPNYPAEARNAGIEGMVMVRVLVDEEGNVISAEAIEGPKELRDVSVAAALKAKFSPTRLQGYPVKVSGTISYNFVR